MWVEIKLSRDKEKPPLIGRWRRLTVGLESGLRQVGQRRRPQRPPAGFRGRRWCYRCPSFPVCPAPALPLAWWTPRWGSFCRCGKPEKWVLPPLFLRGKRGATGPRPASVRACNQLHRRKTTGLWWYCPTCRSTKPLLHQIPRSYDLSLAIRSLLCQTEAFFRQDKLKRARIITLIG